MKMTLGRGALCAAVLTAGVLIAETACGDPIADYYKGRTLTMIAAASAGGGYDVYGRLVAKYLSKHLPGQPKILMQFMPGAGGTQGGELSLQRLRARRLDPRPAVERRTCIPGARRYRGEVRRVEVQLHRPRRLDAVRHHGVAHRRREIARRHEKEGGRVRRHRQEPVELHGPDRPQEPVSPEGQGDHRLSGHQRNHAGAGEGRARRAAPERGRAGSPSGRSGSRTTP